ncbi:MAG: phosphatase PAP2 family protein [Xanthobacteraceae bacterium]
MNRTGLWITLGIAAVVGVVFGIWPDLDLKLAALFYEPPPRGFWRSYAPLYLRLRDAVTWIIALVALPAFVALAVKLVRLGRPMLIPGRAMVLMILTLALAPGVIANLILKEHWGRPRPIDVAEFGGNEHFRAWWDPRGDCAKNCSFVAGEPSGAFWTMAPAFLLPPPWRAAAVVAAVTFGAAVGVLRMAAGAHFFSDVVFAGVFAFLTIWLMHGLLYRWRRTRITDEDVERMIVRISRQ